MMIPTKPAGVNWTDDQWKAMMAKGQDILVAAAAGSGKTAILVQRVIEKILDREEPIDVDRLLVVTFTNASAAEMRHRIREALEEAINAQPTSTHVRRQLNLLNQASISTLHSFCLEVIRKYYYLIDIDPHFRIADETEVELLRDELLDEIFEEEYGLENNEAFYRLVDTFSNDRSDIALQDLVRELYDFSQSHPNPHQWLDELVELYHISDDTAIETLPFIADLHVDIRLQLDGAKQLLEEAYEMTKMPGGPVPRAENYLDDLNIVERLKKAHDHSWHSLYEEMNAWSFTRAKSCRGEEYNKDLVQSANDLRQAAKKTLTKLKEELFLRKPESFLQDLKEMQPIVSRLIELVKKFSKRFQITKMEKGLVDFSDLEHYCLAILTDKNSELNMNPSAAALAYRQQFQEVLVDEYQDTNMVQEAILNLVTADEEADGNLFMVGDVKQSIYRFRLAEPNLFLNKYQRFTTTGLNSGLKIDLSRNFRSRGEILSGTNFIFKQIMGENVGEIQYDEHAELKKGAHYPEEEKYPIELAIIDQSEKSNDTPKTAGDHREVFQKEELEQSQLEARWMAQKVKALIEERKPIYDQKMGSYRPIQYRDIVILLRSMPRASEVMEEFKQAGIPIYADLATGYFEATEISIMLSLLQVIDNPYQDIPFAAVLRSPIVGLNEEQLATIRLHSKKGTYYEAAKQWIKKQPDEKEEVMYEQLRLFFEQLKEWRQSARHGSLASFIWQLYRDTNFYHFVGGLPGGKQRQANLRALYDRALQYEKTSFRGLFRFLRFIERMRERGDDLGTARAISEQEDVVRLMTIHSSKGLEFPVVFVAGLSRKFNMKDIHQPYLFDKDYGFAFKYTNPDKRISYPSLPQMAFKRKQKLEMLAEEMRVLYVAFTRAKEKLFLVASVKDLEQAKEKWGRALRQPDWLLEDQMRAEAMSYLDWIGAALVRHHDCRELTAENIKPHPLLLEEIALHPSCWKIHLLPKAELEIINDSNDELVEDWQERVQAGKPIPIRSIYHEEITERLAWKYPFHEATQKRSKQSVSELKRMYEIRDEASSTELAFQHDKPIYRRPRFIQEKTVTPAERGTAMHSVMQHIPLTKKPTIASIERLLMDMQHKELLTAEQVEVVDPEQVVAFFATEIGKRMLTAPRVEREIPFSLAVPAIELYPNDPFFDEQILVQGVIDCVFEDEKGIVLLDYKTDNIAERFAGDFLKATPVLKKRYATQLAFYERALEQILKQSIREKYLFFFDGSHLLEM